MTLVDALRAAMDAGYTHATSVYSHHARTLKSYLRETQREGDTHDWVFEQYTANSATGQRGGHIHPTCPKQFWIDEFICFTK
jgi:hypothetical protein